MSFGSVDGAVEMSESPVALVYSGLWKAVVAREKRVMKGDVRASRQSEMMPDCRDKSLVDQTFGC